MMPAKTIEPIQTISNSIYSQILFKDDVDYGINSGSPPNEYLTKVISKELNMLCPTGYDNCLLNGMELIILGFQENIINFRILPGLILLDGTLFELNNQYDFDVDVSLNINDDWNKMLFMFHKNGYEFQIKVYLLQDDMIISDNMLEYDNINDLPFRLINVYKNFILEGYNEDNLNDSFYYYPKLSVSFNSDDNLEYSTRHLYHLRYTANQQILNVLSPITLYSFPQEHTIEAETYKIPRYSLIEEELQNRILLWTQ